MTVLLVVPLLTWGAHANIGGRLPIVENPYGYKAPVTLSAAAGALRRLGTKLVLMGGADVVVEDSEHWSGEPYQGRTALQVDGGLEWSPTPRWAFSMNARVPVWQMLADHGHSDADGELKLAPSLSLGGGLDRACAVGAINGTAGQATDITRRSARTPSHLPDQPPASSSSIVAITALESYSVAR